LTVEIGHHSAQLNGIAIDEQQRILVSGSADKTVRVWDLTTGRLLDVLRPPVGKGPEGIIRAVAISPDGKTVACGGHTRGSMESFQIYFFDLESGRLISRVSGMPEPVVRLVFSKDGQRLAAGLERRGGIRLYTFERKGYEVTCRLIKEDRDYRSVCHGLDFDALGHLVASSFDGSLRLYDRELGLIAKQSLSPKDRPLDVSFAPDGSRIAVGYFDMAKVEIFSAGDLKRLVSLNVTTSGPRTDSVNKLLAVSWSPDGRFLFAAGNYYPQPGKNVIIRWNVAGLTSSVNIPVYLPVEPQQTIRAILALRDGGVAYGVINGEIGVFDKDGNQVYTKTSDLDHYNARTFLISPDATVVMYSYENRAGATEKFSVATRNLEENPFSRFGLSPPITVSGQIKISDWGRQTLPKLNGKPLALREKRMNFCYAIAPDHQSVLVGTQSYLHRFDKNGKEIWYRIIRGFPRVVNISVDSRLVVAGLNDGTIRWYRMEDGVELLAFFPRGDGKRWVLWTPSGYYDASEGGDEFVGWSVNDGWDKEASFYPISRFFDRFYRPEVMTQVLKDVQVDTVAVTELGQVAAPKLEAGIKPPPRVAILSPLPDARFDRDELAVRIVAEDMGGGIDEIKLYQNGKVLPRDAGLELRKEGNIREYRFRVKLLYGKNQLRVLAFSRDRIESAPAEISVHLRGAEPESDLYLVIVGINRYRNAALNLTYAEPDALGMKAFFQTDPVKRLFREIHAYSLLNDQATGVSIRSLFDDVAKKAQPQDTLLIYLAGHGDTADDEWYFIPHNVLAPEIKAELKRDGISNMAIGEAIKRCKAQKVFVMIDACKSGRLVVALRSTEERKALVQLARSTGTYIISASTDQQYAAEIRQLGHGVFTYTLLEGLQGKAGEKKVTVEGLIHYVKNRLPELTEKHGMGAQYPVSWGSGMDFPIVLH
jgi:WD40 repeat protein